MRFIAALFLVLISVVAADAKPARTAAVACTDRGCSDWGGAASHHIARERKMMGRRVASHTATRADSGHGLVERARSYIGTNPTGWSAVWCGRFMAMIAPEAATRLKNPNWARDWAELPRTSAQVGVIAVLTRGRRGGHVGVVTGFDERGNPVIISGNHGRRVGEGVYDKRRVIAYVVPS